MYFSIFTAMNEILQLFCYFVKKIKLKNVNYKRIRVNRDARS